MYLKNIFYFTLLIIILSGCAGQTIKGQKDSGGKIPDVPAISASRVLSDSELFEEALSYLSISEKEPNYNEAKIRLAKLVEQYPKSKWTPGAQALMAGMDKISALQLKLKQEKQKVQTDHAKLNKEMEGLRESTRQAEEKYTAEITKLQQENEQLKNDLQQLKKLEVQLEKREKMLR